MHALAAAACTGRQAQQKRHACCCCVHVRFFSRHPMKGCPAGAWLSAHGSPKWLLRPLPRCDPKDSVPPGHDRQGTPLPPRPARPIKAPPPCVFTAWRGMHALEAAAACTGRHAHTSGREHKRHACCGVHVCFSHHPTTQESLEALLPTCCGSGRHVAVLGQQLAAAAAKAHEHQRGLQDDSGCGCCSGTTCGRG